MFKVFRNGFIVKRFYHRGVNNQISSSLRRSECSFFVPNFESYRGLNSYQWKSLFSEQTINSTSKYLYSSEEAQAKPLTKNEFEIICNETLDSLCEYFEELVESCGHLKGCDVVYSDGVLTVHFGNEIGTYVINRQSPNQQIWLSSPTSGPKRYDYVSSKKCWIYRHDNRSLHELLQQEIFPIVKSEVNFFQCSNSGE